MTPELAFTIANTLILPAWLLLAVAPRWVVTRRLVRSGAWPLLYAAAYGSLLVVHYLGPHGGEGGFGSLAEVAALFRDPWALTAGWAHYLCFDLCVGIWEVRDAERRGLPHVLLIPALLFTFLVGPLGLLLYAGLRLLRPAPAAEVAATTLA
ncbi:ABA4-like family protein [Hymenobacter latericus]|uniref:ABA4-like family protein n=1 Tax=Hymenobacter sp. YIM 151858-1 TaxID=2987688 RepID=UPI002227D9D7|nr:ABA4-like family protein [Hymenobacter sp. YIM 151858-1]UYZ59514.1 ABA4-like family protein [Hymenobacter sp. YIM 151858-1]